MIVRTVGNVVQKGGEQEDDIWNSKTLWLREIKYACFGVLKPPIRGRETEALPRDEVKRKRKDLGALCARKTQSTHLEKKGGSRETSGNQEKASLPTE